MACRKVPVVGQLLIADTLDLPQAAERIGSRSGHLAQRRIAEDHVSGNVAASRFVAASQAQVFEQSLIHTFPREILSRCRLGRTFALRRHCQNGCQLAFEQAHACGCHAQHLIFAFAFQELLADQLLDPVANRTERFIFQETIGAQAIVSQLQDPLVRGTHQDLGCIVATEALVQTQHARQNFLTQGGWIIDLSNLAQAYVASAAVIGTQVLPKVSRERAMTTFHSGAKLLHRAQGALGGLSGTALQRFEHLQPRDHIAALYSSTHSDSRPSRPARPLSCW